MVTLYDRLVALKCPHDEILEGNAIVDACAAPSWPLWIRGFQGDDGVVVVTYDPLLAEQPFLLTVVGSAWEFSFAPNGEIERARRGAEWVLEPDPKEQAFTEMVSSLTDQA